MLLPDSCLPLGSLRKESQIMTEGTSQDMDQVDRCYK